VLIIFYHKISDLFRGLQLVSQKRHLVEQAFGTLKRRFQFERASYFTVAKVHGQMTLKAIAFNLLKAVR